MRIFAFIFALLFVGCNFNYEKAVSQTEITNFISDILSDTTNLKIMESKKTLISNFDFTPELPIEFDADGGGTNTIKLKGDVTTHSGGLMFGAQWQIGKMVMIDWWILGGHYGVSKGTLSGVPSSSLSANEQDDIRTIINDFENDIPLTKITADVSANNVKAIVDGPWAGVRAGLTIGIRF